MNANAHSSVSADSRPDRLEAYALENVRLQEALTDARQALAQTMQMLADAQRLTKTGGWVIDPIGGGASGSAECYRILGLPGKTSSVHFMRLCRCSIDWFDVELHVARLMAPHTARESNCGNRTSDRAK